MEASEIKPDVQAPDPTLKIGLAVVIGIAVLGLALMLGAGIGRRRAEQEEKDDPIAALEQERSALEAEALTLAPPLHGRGEGPSAEAIDALEARHADLLERARKVALPLETSQIQAVVARARFEACLARGGEAAFQEATLLLRRVGHRGEEPVLRARLELAQGKEPDVSWLASWTDVEDPAVAEAARLLSASLYAAREPDRARRLVSARVDERLAKEVLARIDLASAARSLDPNSVRLQISTAGRAVAEAPRLRREIAQVGLREGTATIPSYEKVERVLRVVGLLRGEIGSDGTRLAHVAFVVARRCLVELDAEAPKDPEAAAEQRAAKVAVLIRLLEAIAESRLRSGPCAEAGSFLDDLLGARAPAEAKVREAGALAACRLDARLHPVHLEALAGSRAAFAQSTRPVLRALALRLEEEPPQPGLVQPLEASLPPVQRSQLLLAAQAALPAGPDRQALCARARELDASPAALLAVLAAASQAPSQDATTRLGGELEALTQGRPLLRPYARAALLELAKLQEGWAQAAAARETRALARERYASE